MANRDLPPSVYRVAGFITTAIDGGRGVYATGRDSAAKALGGMATSTVQSAIAHLVRRGYLLRTREPSRGRNATEYRLVIPAEPTEQIGRLTDVHSRSVEESVTDRSEKFNRPIRVPQPTDSIGPNHKRSERRDQGGDDLAALRRAGALMSRGGASIAGEWSDLLDVPHGVGEILKALNALAPRDRWPSKVRAQIELAGELPGLVERRASPDEIRAILGHPSEVADG